MSALGYVDELIRHIDSKKKIWYMFSKQGLSWQRAEPSLATDLARSPKFTLPTLGQFYRPLDELSENNRHKYACYIEGFELDMLRYPPYNMFVLEFKGHDQHINIQSSVMDDKQMDRYIMLCRAVEINGNKGIGARVFYYNEHSSPATTTDGKIIFPAGWMTNGIEYASYYEPPNEREKHPRENGYLVRLPPIGWYPPHMTNDILVDLGSALWPEFRALYQFLVVMNIKKGVTRTNVSTPKSSKPTLAGRRTGYEYHVLEIDPEYVAESISSGGTHASPRFHMRRAHLRHYSDGKITFVRQAQVGNPLLGTVAKDYIVKKD